MIIDSFVSSPASIARSAAQAGTIGGGSGAAAVASLPNANILDAINSVREYKAPPAPNGAGKSLDIGGYTSSPIACSASSAGSVGGGSGAAAAA